MTDTIKDFIKEKKRLEDKYPGYTFEVDISKPLFPCSECAYEVGHSLFCKKRKEIL